MDVLIVITYNMVGTVVIAPTRMEQKLELSTKTEMKKSLILFDNVVKRSISTAIRLQES